MKNLKPIYDKHGTGSLHFRIKRTINSPLNNVWNNFVKADNIKKYFTNNAIGDLDKPGEVIWEWTNETVLIRVLEVEDKKRVKFEWNGNNVNYKITCEFNFDELNNKTIITINEWGWENDEAVIKSSYENCSGWTEYLDTLKVFTIYNIAFLKD